MKKKIFTLFLTVIMVMSMGTSMAMADTDIGSVEDEIMTCETGGVAIGYKRLSNSEATGEVKVDFLSIVRDYSVTVTLQEKHGSKWTTNFGISGAVHQSHGSNDHVFFHDYSWKGLKKGYIYRIRVLSKDTQHNGIQCTSTSYSDPF